MSYRALYRVWRPQRFNELVGQDVISQTLKNTITTGQVSHAYLFTGPRGTGKTSTAKIFAKAVNCPHSKNGEPCNKCKICKAITKGTLNDVVEIDAASNNGVDEIRNVRDKAKYAPTEAKYKIYIIDEVHMLSIGAFNALLKTLEEPPKHVIFIMATTDPQKVPATIISRVQRFNFKRINPKDILHRMEYILHHEQDPYDVRALKLIAQSAEGGMRDALSILDEVLSYSKDKVTYDSALQVTGNVTQGLLYKYLKSVTSHHVKTALQLAQKILASGKDANQFVESLINYCQDILLYQQSPKTVMNEELGVASEKFKHFAKSLDSDLAYDIIEELNHTQEEMQFTVHPDVYLEVLTVKLSKLQIMNPKVAMKRITQLTNTVKSMSGVIKAIKDGKIKVEGGNNQSNTDLDVTGATNTTKKIHNKVHLDIIKPILKTATRPDLDKVKKAWPKIVNCFTPTKSAMLRVSKPAAVSENGVIIASTYNFFAAEISGDKKLLKGIQARLSEYMGKTPIITVLSLDQWKKIRHDYYTHDFTDDSQTSVSGKNEAKNRNNNQPNKPKNK